MFSSVNQQKKMVGMQKAAQLRASPTPGSLERLRRSALRKKKKTRQSTSPSTTNRVLLPATPVSASPVSATPSPSLSQPVKGPKVGGKRHRSRITAQKVLSSPSIPPATPSPQPPKKRVNLQVISTTYMRQKPYKSTDHAFGDCRAFSFKKQCMLC